MKALLTGASSFSGMWFAEKLVAAGMHVVAPLRASQDTYSGVRARRVERLQKIAEIVPDCEFGGETFMDLVSSRAFDALCYHAAEVGNYRSFDFDVTRAVAANTRNLRAVLDRMLNAGLRAVIATGSVFEQDEGAGNSPLRAFSPYGLSKGLTWQVLRHWCVTMGAPLAKFIIANPFGPFEEPRFGAYLINAWRRGETAEIRTPSYLRDNIHVELLALAYTRFVREMIDTPAARRLGPCGYIETQGAFAERVAREMAPRLGFECRVRTLAQSDFSEPLARINTDIIDIGKFDWQLSSGWDAMAAFYRS